MYCMSIKEGSPSGLVTVEQLAKRWGVEIISLRGILRRDEVRKHISAVRITYKSVRYKKSEIIAYENSVQDEKLKAEEITITPPAS